MSHHPVQAMNSPSIRHLVASFVLFAACASVAAAQNSQNAQRPDSSRVRFRDPEHITGDPTGLSVDFTGLMAPRYPDDARAAEQASVPVVAFVVDTTGHIESATASFLNDPPPAFRAAVCEALPEIRFHPLVLDGQRQRVLLVQLYAFNTLKTPDSVDVARADSLVKATQERFGTRPVTDVIPELEALPHCN